MVNRYDKPNSDKSQGTICMPFTEVIRVKPLWFPESQRHKGQRTNTGFRGCAVAKEPRRLGTEVCERSLSHCAGNHYCIAEDPIPLVSKVGSTCSPRLPQPCVLSPMVRSTGHLPVEPCRVRHLCPRGPTWLLEPPVYIRVSQSPSGLRCRVWCIGKNPGGKN